MMQKPRFVSRLFPQVWMPLKMIVIVVAAVIVFVVVKVFSDDGIPYKD